MVREHRCMAAPLFTVSLFTTNGDGFLFTRSQRLLSILFFPCIKPVSSLQLHYWKRAFRGIYITEHQMEG